MSETVYRTHVSVLAYQVQSWFQDRQQSNPLEDASLLNPSEKWTVVPEACLNKAYESALASKEGNLISGLLFSTMGYVF